MKPRATLRHQLGLSQLEMAMYLNINLSLLAMYEIGARDLPTAARVQLAAIEVFLYETEKENFHETKPSIEQLEIMLKELNSQQKENEFKLLKAQMQWETLQKRATQKQNLVAVLNHLTQDPKNKANAKSLKILELSIPRSVEPIATKALLKLQLKRKALEDQSKFIETLITETQIALDAAKQNR